jgi:hypothetical protein
MSTQNYDKDTEEAILTARFLKAVANDPNSETDLQVIAEQLGIPDAAGTAILGRFKNLMLADSENTDFPARLLNSINNKLPIDRRKAEGLTKEDIKNLEFLAGYKVPQPQIQQKIPKKVMSEGNVRNVVHNDMVNSSSSGGMLNQQQEEEDPDVELMRSILENNFNPRPHFVDRFIKLFRKWKHQWLAQPQKLLAVLKANFQPSAGETAFMMFMDQRPSVAEDDPMNLFRLTGVGASNYRPQDPSVAAMAAGAGMGAGAGVDPSQYISQGMGSQYGYGYGYPPTSKFELMALQEDMRFNRQIEKMMKVNTVLTMNQMQRQNLPGMMGDQNGGVVHKEYGPDGKVIHTWTAPPTQQPNPADTGLSKMAEIMAQQNNILLQRISTPDPIISNLTSKIFETSMDKSDSWKQMGHMMEMFNSMRQNAGIGGPQDPTMAANNVKIAEMQNDVKLALAEMKLQHESRVHEWDLQAAEAQRAEENTQTFFKLASEFGGKLMGPFVERIARGYADKLGIGGQQGQEMPMQPGVQMQMPPQTQGQQVVMDPRMMAAYGIEPEVEGVHLSPAQVEQIKAERRHLIGQAKANAQRMAAIQRQAEAQTQQPHVHTYVQQPPPPSQEDVFSPITIEQKLAQASDEEIASVEREVRQAVSVNESIYNRILAEKAKRTQGIPRVNYSNVTNPAQQTQPQQEYYEQEQSEPEPEQQASQFGTPKNFQQQDEQTGTVAAVGGGGLRNQVPKSQQEEAAMMYGYTTPMSFSAPRTSDVPEVAQSEKKNILASEEEEIQNDEETEPETEDQ